MKYLKHLEWCLVPCFVNINIKYNSLGISVYNQGFPGIVCKTSFDQIFINPVNNYAFFNFSQPTRDDRGWFVTPLGPNPWWTVIAAIIPALLCTILIFMDQQITAVIINRKEHKLKVYYSIHFNVNHYDLIEIK